MAGQIKFHQPNSPNSFFFARFVPRRGQAVSRREITLSRFASPGRFVATASLSFASWPRHFLEFIGPIGQEANSKNKKIPRQLPRNGEQNFARPWGPGFDAPLSLCLSSGPSSLPSGIVEGNPLFVAGRPTSQQRFFRIASKQRRTGVCHAVHATLFGELMRHRYFQFRRHSHFLSTSVHS